MPPRPLEREIEQLYKLPLDEFTAARNALARSAGKDAAEVRALAKPPVSAWAVNQLFWKRRDVYAALIEASTELRKVHKAILGGRRADLRDASKAHEEALDAALKAALAILQESGHPATDSTRQAVLTTLRALPSEEAPGRLSRTLQPGGFEMLQGLSIAGAGGRLPVSLRPKVEPARESTSGAAHGKPAARQSKADAAAARAEAAKTDAARAGAAKAVREAEQAARREEFEVVRTTRDEEKAIKQVTKAREDLEAAKAGLREAEAAAAQAARSREAAGRRAKDAERALDAAQRQHDALRKA